MRTILFLFSSAILFTSCGEDFFSQTIEVEQPEYKKQLAVHQLTSSNEFILGINLTRNFGILETVTDTAWNVAGAEVAYYVNGNKVLELQPGSAQTMQAHLYQAAVPDDFWQVGTEYELRITHPDYPNLVARQTLPGPFSIDSVRYREDGGVDEFGDDLSAIDVYLEDPGGVENFYEVYAAYTSQEIRPVYDNQGNVVGYDTLPGYSNELYPEQPEDPKISYGAFNTLLVSDDFFNGQEYKFRYRFYNYTSPNYHYTFHVRVRNITRDYYTYSRSAFRLAESEDNGLPLVEPVQVHDNIEGGIGIFGLSWQQDWIAE